MKTKNTAQIGVASLLSIVALLALSMLAPLATAQGDVIPESTSQVAQADTTPPSDVENLKATAGNGTVSLSWNVATDTGSGIKGYRIYYGTSPVVDDGDTYPTGPVDVGNKITHTLTGLNNGTTYYFALTAYDEAGNESENYSVEASATPAHAAADTEAPKVLSAEAMNMLTVKVGFSEEVVLPTTNPQAAFTIKNDGTQVALTVSDAVMDTDDITKKTVILTTSQQQAGASYILTAGIQVKDTAGNPIVSGTSDTAVFTGTDIQPPVVTQETQAQADTTGPEMVDVIATDANHLSIKFSEPVKLAADPTQNFIITEEENIENTIEVLLATLSADGTTVTLTVDPLQAINYNLIVVDVTDDMGNLISVDNNATVFTGVAGETQETQVTTQETQEGDTAAPEDATNFVARMLTNMMVNLTWTASLNSAGDLANYILYKSNDGNVYGDGVILNPTATSFDLSSLVPGMKYFFKLTAKDTAGNESAGVVASFVLPGTGPELGLLLLGSFGLGKFLKRKKKK